MNDSPAVFRISAALILVFVILGAAYPVAMGTVFNHLQDWIVETIGWYYILAVAFFLAFVIWLFLSPYGKVRLGSDDDQPDYSRGTWFAMLFSAGMGIGLLFYSVAEPVLHFDSPRLASPDTVAAAKEAMKFTFFHWGLHAWAIYIVVGLALAYFHYRHGMPLTIRSTLYPLLGERIHGPIGQTVEVLAVFGTLFGVATSLGLGVMQINAGLNYLGFVSVSTTTQLVLIAVITAMATASVVSGLDVGIRRLSELNMLLAALLALFVFIAGPTVFLMSSFVQGTGNYLFNLVPMMFHTDAFKDLEWEKTWTMFYWGWWISWSPFVGMFIARISKGRTIREFIAGVLLVPTLVTFFWLVVFGNTALHMELMGDTSLSEVVSKSVPTALFVMLDKLPWATITSLLAVVVVTSFFVTSSDSASLVVDILTSGGDPNPPLAKKIFWAVSEGVVAAVLLLSGGLAALQTAAVTTALPFSFVMLAICASLVAGLRAERDYRGVYSHRAAGLAQPEGAGVGGLAALAMTTGDWRETLSDIIQDKRERRRPAAAGPVKVRPYISNFLDEVVVPAFEEIKQGAGGARPPGRYRHRPLSVLPDGLR